MRRVHLAAVEAALALMGALPPAKPEPKGKPAVLEPWQREVMGSVFKEAGIPVQLDEGTQAPPVGGAVIYDEATDRVPPRVWPPAGHGWPVPSAPDMSSPEWETFRRAQEKRARKAAKRLRERT